MSARSVDIQFKLSNSTTSTASELTAIREALLYLKRELPQKSALFCDSRPALQCLHSALRRGLYEQLVAEIRQEDDFLVRHGHNIIFQWLPSHGGIFGNECADKAAHYVHGSVQLADIPLSRHDTARSLRSITRKITLTLWNGPEFSNSRLYLLDPDLQHHVPINMLRSDATLLYRLWIGVAFTKAYSFTIGIAPSPACDVCATDCVTVPG